MNNIHILFLHLLLCVLFSNSLLAAQTQQRDFSKYDIIITRRPFGSASLAESAVAATVVAPSPVIPPAESFVKNYKMCAIRESKSGVSVGLVNISAEPIRSFFLFVGDSEEGVELLEADFDKERALLRKDGDEQWVAMSSTAGAVVGSNPMGISDNAELTGLQNLISARLEQARNMRKRPFTGWTKEVYKEKLAAGEIPPPTPAHYALRGKPEDADLTREEREAKLRRYNMDLIRAGGEQGVPLPIALTPEEDAQLVQEGVLPPQ